MGVICFFFFLLGIVIRGTGAILLMSESHGANSFPRACNDSSSGSKAGLH